MRSPEASTESVEETAEALGMNLVIEGYTPPYDPRWRAWKSLLNRPALRVVRAVIDATDPTAPIIASSVDGSGVE